MTNNEINNFNELNDKENLKEIKKIEITNEYDFEGQLIIEDYSELETLYLHDIQTIDKITLKNLSKLQECTIWECGTKELIIKNCPQIKKLNLRKNSLTSLGFLVNLEKLEELRFDGNAKLTEILKAYEDKGGWKVCQKDIKELSKSIEENPQLLSELREEIKFSQQKYADLKTFLREVWVSISEEKQTKLMSKLDSEMKSRERRMSVHHTTSGDLKTIEIVLGVKKALESMKELKKELETELVESEVKILGLKKKLKEQKSLYQQKEKELLTQQDETKALLKELLAKTNEKVETSNEGDKENLQKQINNLNQRLIEADRREFKLRGELKSKKEEIEWMRKEISTPKIQNIQNAMYGSQSINTYHIQYNLYYQQLTEETEKEISKPLTNLQITEQDKQVISQTIIFWGAQELFFNYRKNTIDKLVNYYCQLANKTKLTKKWTTRINSVMGITSKLTKTIPSGSIAETPLGIIGDIAVLTGIILEDKHLGKCIKEFKEIIKKDGQDLNFFDQSYHSLATTIWNNNQSLSPATTKIVETLNLVKEKPYPFSKDQDIYQISAIRQEYFANLNSEQLKSFLEGLDKNLVELYQSFEKQKQQLNEQAWFKAIEQQTNLLQEQRVQTQIQVDPIKAF